MWLNRHSFLAFLLLLALTLPLVACSGDEVPAPRIDIHVFSFDGVAPEGLRAVRVSAPGEVEDVYPLERVPGGRDEQYQAPGAPDGSYRIEGPEGWWMLHLGAMAPVLKVGRAPGRVGLGHGHTLYLGPAAPSVRPSGRWGAERVIADGANEPIPVTVLAEDGGYTIAVRLPPEEWHGEIQVIGHVELGPVGSRREGDPLGPLAEPLRLKATPDGRPVVRRIRQAPASPLQVVLVPADADTRVDGILVRALLDRLPLRVEQEERCQGGIARFRAIPAVDRDVLVSLGGRDGDHRLTPGHWRHHASMRVLVHPPETPRREVRVVVPGDVVVDRVQVRPSGAVAYGRVLFAADGDVQFETPPGVFTALLHAGTRFAEIDGAGEGDLLTAAPVFEKGVHVGGRVRDAVSGMTVRFFRHMGEEAILGDGFELSLGPAGEFEGVLPMGTYTVEVVGPRGTWQRPAPVVADKPGARLHLPLSGS